MYHQCLTVLIIFSLNLTLLRADDAQSRAIKELEGDWRAVEAECNGKKIPAADLRGLRAVFKDETLTVLAENGAKKWNKSFRVDPSKSPMHMDIVAADGRKKGQSAACVYALEKGKLRICMLKFGVDPKYRPIDFRTKKGDGLFTVVFERAKSN